MFVVCLSSVTYRQVLAIRMFTTIKRATNSVTDAPFQVKIINKLWIDDEIDISDLLRECSIMQTLSGHPHIAHFYDFAQDDSYLYFITEFVRGIWARLSRRRRLAAASSSTASSNASSTAKLTREPSPCNCSMS